MESQENEFYSATSANELAKMILGRLSTIYDTLEVKGLTFLQLLDGMLNDTHPNRGEWWTRRLYEELGEAEVNEAEKEKLVSPFGYGVLVCSGYCIDANRADHAGNSALAWSYAAEAKYWLGLLIGGYTMHETQNDLKTQFLKSMAKKKAAKYDPLKALTESLALKKPYKSRRSAAKQIAPAVLTLAKELDIYISPDQVEITVQGWLKEKGIVFAGKHSTSTSKSDTSSS